VNTGLSQIVTVVIVYTPLLREYIVKRRVAKRFSQIVKSSLFAHIQSLLFAHL